MRSQTRTIAGVLVTLVGVCIGCSGDTTPTTDPSTPPGAPAGRDPAAPLPDQALRPVVYPSAAEAIDADVVLFLPIVNRSSKRIHQSYLRALDRTLAAHAAAQLGLRPVRPELARLLAADLGIGQGHWSISQIARPREEALQRAAERVGAGTIVWGEIRKDRTLAFHASGYAPGAHGKRWDGIELPETGPVDLALYDAPRRLLDAMESAGRIPAQGGTEQPDEAAEAQLAQALTWISLGQPMLRRRAEVSLAELATRHPDWPTPWVRLAFLRAQRGQLRNAQGPDAGTLAEGSDPARHIARRFAHLDPEDRARLDAIDHLFLLHLQTPAQLEELLARAPADARVLLAHRHTLWARASFHLDDVTPESDFERDYLAVAAAPTPAARMAYASEQSTAIDPAEVIFRPYLVRVVTEMHRALGAWMDEYRWSQLAVPAQVMAVLEILRDRCAALEHGRDACLQPLRELATAYLKDPDEAQALALAGGDAWDEQIARVGVASLGAAISGENAEWLPDLEVFRQDDRFARSWLALARLISTANAVLEVHDTSAKATGPAGSALLDDPRPLLRDHLSWLIETAYQPAYIGKKRAQRDEAEPYLDALAPFDGDFPVARQAGLTIRSALGFRGYYTQGWGSLAKEDLFDERWVGRWLGSMSHNKGAEMSVSNARLLGSVVPNNHTVARFRGQAWREAERLDKAIEVLRASSASMPDPELALQLDDVLAEASRTDAEREAVLAPAIEVFRADPRLRSRLAYVMLWSGRTREAERLFKSLRTDPKFFDDACYGIGRILSIEKGAAAMERHYTGCLEYAPTRWVASGLYDHLAGLAALRSDYDAALAALGKAEGLIGGAGYVLADTAYAHELAGDYAAAESYYRRYTKAYPRSHDGRLYLAKMFMRQGDLESARTVVEGADPDPEKDYAVYVMLGRLALAGGKFDAFVERVRQAHGQQALSALTQIYYWIHDYEAELAAAEYGIQAYPEGDFDSVHARCLVDLGRFAEAREYFEGEFARDPMNSWVREKLVRVLLGLGETRRAQELVEEWARMRPFSGDAADMRARVYAAAGAVAKARAELRRGAAFAPETGNAGFRDWWYSQRFWVEREAELGFDGLPRAELQERVAHVERLLHRLPYDLNLWSVLADLRERLGQREAAAEARVRAELFNPRSADTALARRS